MGQANKVVLDTNMLMAAGELKIDVFEEIKKYGRTEFFVPEEVLEELKKLKEKNRTKKINAGIAEKLIEKHCSLIKGNTGNADKKMQELAEKGFIIATNDKQLRTKIRKKGFKTAFVRQKKIIVVE
ncbi:MAG: PIN domain-containing protein [archaeon]